MGYDRELSEYEGTSHGEMSSQGYSGYDRETSKYKGASYDRTSSNHGSHSVFDFREKEQNKKGAAQKKKAKKIAGKAVGKQQTDKKKSSKIMALAMKRRTRRKRIQKFMVAMLVVFAFCSGFFGRTLFDAYAKEPNGNAPIPYYTSIQLAPGDNLWKIANRYAEQNGYTVTEYVEQLKQMNGLTDGHVHSGEYLTIVYFPE